MQCFKTHAEVRVLGAWVDDLVVLGAWGRSQRRIEG